VFPHRDKEQKGLHVIRASNQLKEPPPYPDLISVAPDGSLDYESDNLDVLLALDQWLRNRACDHEEGILLHHRIGNMALVGMLRAELDRAPEKFPILLKQVLYSGTHCGDYLSLDDVGRLHAELFSLETP
jgi:hypothetical protein